MDVLSSMVLLYRAVGLIPRGRMRAIGNRAFSRASLLGLRTGSDSWRQGHDHWQILSALTFSGETDQRAMPSQASPPRVSRTSLVNRHRVLWIGIPITRSSWTKVGIPSMSWRRPGTLLDRYHGAIDSGSPLWCDGAYERAARCSREAIRSVNEETTDAQSASRSDILKRNDAKKPKYE
jgi:hypothetical protein